VLDFLWFALGFGSLLVAAALCLALLRAMRTLAALEQALITADEAMREVVPELRGGLATANDIAAGLHVALRSAAPAAGVLNQAAARSRRGALAALFGARVAARSLVHYAADGRRPGGADGRS
jgi:hypothetical protein